MLLPAPFREIHEPLLKLIAKLDESRPGRSVAVLIPEIVQRNPIERLLHNQRAAHLRKMLIEHGDDRVKVIVAPWRRGGPAKAFAEPKLRR